MHDYSTLQYPALLHIVFSSTLAVLLEEEIMAVLGLAKTVWCVVLGVRNMYTVYRAIYMHYANYLQAYYLNILKFKGLFRFFQNI